MQDGAFVLSANINDAATNQLPLVLRQRDLAKLLDVSERSVERYRRAKQLPDPLIDGARPRWGRDQVLRWLNGGRR